MAWKLDEKGNIAVQDSMPVWIGDDGSEVAFDAKANIIAAATAKREAAESRKALKETQTQLEAFKGIEDPVAALEALKFATSLDGKKIMGDEEIKRLIESNVTPWKEKATNSDNLNAELQGELYKEKVSKQFATSKFLNEKTILTPDMAESNFGKQVKLENGKVVMYDKAGNQIYSTTKTGELASFEEGMSILWNEYEYKDRYTKGTGGSGSGSQASNTTVSGLNAKLAGLSPTERITAARAAGITT